MSGLRRSVGQIALDNRSRPLDASAGSYQAIAVLDGFKLWPLMRCDFGGEACSTWRRPGPTWMEDPMHHSRRGFVILMIVAAVVVRPWTAEATPFCPVRLLSPFVSAF